MELCNNSCRMIFVSAYLPSPNPAFFRIIHLGNELHSHFLQHAIRGVYLGQGVRYDSVYLLVSESIIDHRLCCLSCKSAIPMLGSNFISDLYSTRLVRFAFETAVADQHSVFRMNKEVSAPVRWRLIGFARFVDREGK